MTPPITSCGVPFVNVPCSGYAALDIAELRPRYPYRERLAMLHKTPAGVRKGLVGKSII
jgi:hypothetical protein